MKKKLIRRGVARQLSNMFIIHATMNELQLIKKTV